jgi:cytoskeletal protein CcmA (bactofilin family)
MFSMNTAKAEAKAAKNREKPAAPSILGKNLRITGNLESDGDIQIEGIINGDVTTRLLTIGPEAVVNGSISCDTVRVDGTVKGQIRGRLVELVKSAKVTGDIVHQILSIEAGALVHGMCKNIEPEKQQSESVADRPILAVTNDENNVVL